MDVYNIENQTAVTKISFRLQDIHVVNPTKYSHRSNFGRLCRHCKAMHTAVPLVDQINNFHKSVNNLKLFIHNLY